MGREVRRVPIGYSFPIGESAANVCYDYHRLACSKSDHDECEYPSFRSLIPVGDGWQLWQTVSDGPISPVFATPEELIDWMCLPDPNNPDRSFPLAQGWTRDVAGPFVVRQMSAPALVTDGRGGVMMGAEFMVRSSERDG